MALPWFLYQAIIVGGLGAVYPAPEAIGPSRTNPDSLVIASIRQAYRRIERNLPAHRRVRHDLYFSLEGGYLDAWFDASRLEKLKAMYYGEIYRGSESYYFVGDTLVFMFDSTEWYDQPMSGHVVRRDENRFYFHNQQLIRWIDSTRAEHSTTSDDARERASEIQRIARLLIACAGAAPSDSAACTAALD